MTRESLINYCESMSQTPRALIDTKRVALICYFAGVVPSWIEANIYVDENQNPLIVMAEGKPDFLTMKEEMRDLVEKARMQKNMAVTFAAIPNLKTEYSSLKISELLSQIYNPGQMWEYLKKLHERVIEDDDGITP